MIATGRSFGKGGGEDGSGGSGSSAGRSSFAASPAPDEASPADARRPAPPFLSSGSTSWSRPSTKTKRAFVSFAKGSPVQATTFAIFPASRLPVASARPRASAAPSVAARSAASRARPRSTARRTPATKSGAQAETSANGTPAFASSAGFASASRIARRSSSSPGPPKKPPPARGGSKFTLTRSGVFRALSRAASRNARGAPAITTRTPNSSARPRARRTSFSRGHVTTSGRRPASTSCHGPSAAS